MKRALTMAVVVGLWGCGPDATGLISGADVDADGTETVDGELTASNGSNVWLPMATANEWTYESAAGTRTIRTSQVGSGAAMLQGLLDADTWIGAATSTSPTLQAWDGQAWKAFLRFGYARTSWTFGDQPCTGFTLRRAATGVVVTTPAGSFADTRVIALAQKPDPLALCAPPAVTELTFAANVGLVAFTTGRGERFTLRGATVAGQRVPASPVRGALSLDHASYTNRANTIRCITTPCPTNEVTAVARATFTLTNGGSASVAWQFNSGCQFDVDVLSPAGTVVKRLLQDTACAQHLTQLALAPGESRTFTADVKLADAQGLQLSGNFSMRARLIPRGGAAAPTATTDCQVRVQ